MYSRGVPGAASDPDEWRGDKTAEATPLSPLSLSGHEMQHLKCESVRSSVIRQRCTLQLLDVFMQMFEQPPTPA